MIRKILASGAAVMAVALTASAADAPAAPKVDLSKSTDLFAPAAAPAVTFAPTTVVAVVNGENILESEIGETMTATMSQMRLTNLPPDRAAMAAQGLRSQVIEGTIMKRVLVQAIDKEKIQVSDAEVDAELKKISGELPPGKTLESVLAQNGQSMDKFREGFALNLRVKKLVDGHIGASPKVSDDDVKKFYEDNKDRFFAQPESARASHILIKTPEGATEDQKKEAKKKLEAIRERVVKGEDFAKLAAENSDCPSKERGGDLGEFPRGRMVKAFEDAAFAQKVGDVGPVIETQFGYHIVKVATRTEARTVPMDEVKAKISEHLSNEQKQKAAQTYLKELREKAKIEYGAGQKPAEPAKG